MNPSLVGSSFVEVVEYDHVRVADENYSRLSTESPATPRSSFFVFTSPGRDRRPFHRYLHEGYGDVFMTAEWGELAYGFGDWQYRGIVGYVYDYPTQHTTRLYRWFNDRIGRHAYATNSDPTHIQSADGWVLEGPIIYVASHSDWGRTPCTVPESGSDVCAQSLCTRKRMSCAAHCDDHIDDSDYFDLERQVADKIDRGSRTMDLSGIALHEQTISFDTFMHEEAGQQDGWFIDLSGALVSGSFEVGVPPNASIDLSNIRVKGDLTVRGIADKRIGLSGATIDGSLIVRDAGAKEAVFADNARVAGDIRISDLVAKDASVYFDGISASRVEISNSNFDTLSFAGGEVSVRSLITNTTIDTLICTRLTAAKDWALRRSVVGTHAGFEFATIAEHLNLEFNVFEGSVRLKGAECGEAIHLNQSRYLDTVDVGGIVTPWLDMHSAEFRGQVLGSSIEVRDVVDLRDAVMSQPILITAAPSSLVLDGVVFHREATLLFSGTAILAARARFDRSSRIGSRDAPSRLMDLTDCDVSKLTLDNVDLSLCRMSDALNLENIQFGGNVRFATLPRHLKGTSGFRWRAERKVVWDEILLRADRRVAGWTAWRDRLVQSVPTLAKPGFGWASQIPSLDVTPTVTEGRLSATYSDLRRALESRGEGAAASEFYYSEMTIRRRESNGWKRVVYWLYWLLGGYGVRPSRPLAVFVLSACLITVGLVQLRLLSGPASMPQSQVGYAGAVRYLLRTSTTILGASEFQPVGFGGALLDVLSRLFLPGLLGLSFIGVRSIVKR